MQRRFVSFQIMTESPEAASRALDFCLLIPIYNDWESLNLLIKEIAGVLEKGALQAGLFIVNDGSLLPSNLEASKPSWQAFQFIEIIQLRRNIGHQRAITTGLTTIYSQRPCPAVFVLDGDGEDKAEDIPRLWEKYQEHSGQKIVFAERTRRSEGFVFTVLYKTYQLLHLLLTGLPVKVGNFSVIPFWRLSNLVVISEMWNHYAAAVLKSKLPFETVSTSRGKRLIGKSKIGWVGLFVHGLSALAVFGDIVGTRLLLLTVALFLASSLALSGLFFGAALLDFNLSQSMALLFGFVLLFLSQTLTMAAGIVFFVLSTRNGAGFLPIRDCPFFVEKIELLSSKNAELSNED
ncbi:MAG: glycosyltransferase [Planctomycetota bacterium]|nr:glycosyltransferase [Planctomycetota bacterium]